MDRRSIAWAAILLGLAVLFGAFGAHGLRTKLDPSALAQWMTGVEYQYYHALGLLALGAISPQFPKKAFSMIRWLFLSGIGCFSGSLYLLSTRDITGLDTLPSLLGPITPIGGLCFIAGWAILLITVLRPNDQG